MDARRAMRGQAFGASEPSHGSPSTCLRAFSRASGAVIPVSCTVAAANRAFLSTRFWAGPEHHSAPGADLHAQCKPMHVPAMLHAGMTNCTHDKLHARTPSLPPVDGAAPRSVPQRRGDEGGGRAAHAAHLAPPPLGCDSLQHCTTAGPCRRVRARAGVGGGGCRSNKQQLARDLVDAYACASTACVWTTRTRSGGANGDNEPSPNCSNTSRIKKPVQVLCAPESGPPRNRRACERGMGPTPAPEKPPGRNPPGRCVGRLLRRKISRRGTPTNSLRALGIVDLPDGGDPFGPGGGSPHQCTECTERFNERLTHTSPKRVGR